MRQEDDPPRCPLCGSAMRRLFSTRDLLRPQDDERYQVAWCTDCEHGKVVGSFTPERVAAFYDIPYYTHQAEAPDVAYPFARRLVRSIAWRFDNGRDFSAQEFGAPGKVIDLGCGSGDAMRSLRAAGFSVVGVEPDSKARVVAAAHGEVHAGTAEELPQQLGSDAPFDYALLSHVLEHTVYPQAALNNVHALLRSHGKLIVEVPNCHAAAFEAFGPDWPWTDVPRHLHFFTQRSLRKLLEAAGFRIDAVRFTGFTRQYLNPGTGWDSKWARQGWRVMLRTAVARDDRKYDSIRVHAIRD